MLPQRCAPTGRTAILSFHSHGDRSFLDDRELALISGDLRRSGIENDLVVVVLGGGSDEDQRDVERRLVATLSNYQVIIFERVWSRELIARLLEQLPGRTVISCQGEHALEDPPADYTIHWQLRHNVPALLAWIRGETDAAPASTQVREGGLWVSPPNMTPWSPRDDSALPYTPNLRPVVINAEALPSERTFSITGNSGCPFQLDARENPLYAGITIPGEFGKGCAFCTTGNKYEARSNPDTAASVLEQLRYVRANAPELSLLVLKDQNPFGYLTEVIEACAGEGVGGFTLLLETRADWFLRNARRFERALEVARGSAMRLAPFLVGVENFSQPELDRFNKGTTAAANVEFLETLWRWKETYGEALELSHTSFGFILFSPWTTMDDLAVNLAAIKKTRFDRFRGSVLMSRARLYPDTALYYLAQRDGLLTEEYKSEEDNSRRYGYYPAHPWRFAHDDVAHFATVATELSELTGSKDQVSLFQQLLDAFRAAPDYRSVTAEAALARYQSASPSSATAPSPAPPELRQRFAQLVQPLPLGDTFGEGWRFGDLQVAPGRLRVRLTHDREIPVEVELVPRGTGPFHGRSRHYDIRYLAGEITPSQRAAVNLLCNAIAQNDR